MQVQMENKAFTKTKFDGLDGKTTVSFVSEDESFEGRATKSGVKFKLSFEASSHEELEAHVHVFGALMDATFTEFQMLKPKLMRTLTGHE